LVFKLASLAPIVWDNRSVHNTPTVGPAVTYRPVSFLHGLTRCACGAGDTVDKLTYKYSKSAN
jgi:hypothetical protein